MFSVFFWSEFDKYILYVHWCCILAVDEDAAVATELAKKLLQSGVSVLDFITHQLKFTITGKMISSEIPVITYDSVSLFCRLLLYSLIKFIASLISSLA